MNEQYRDYLRNKSVAVVGGHDYINWNTVNRADIVVRINSHQIRQSGRCDVIYFSCADDVDPNVFKQQELQQTLQWAWLNQSHLLFGANVDVYNAARRNMPSRTNVAHFFQAPAQAWQLFHALRQLAEEHRWPEKLAAKYDFHPLTGMIAIYHLLSFPIAEMYVDGMTLYQRGNNFVEKAGTHHIAPQLAFLRDCRKDKRLILSKRINLLIDKYSSEATNFLSVR